MNKTPVLISGTLFFWAGFVVSISFMEAWLKFQAPGVTLPIGLSIGKLVFTALNRMEWVFLFLLGLIVVPKFNSLPKKFFYFSAILPVILVIQTFFLLPELNLRAELIIAGSTPGKSNAHLVFGIVEVLKVIFLISLGFYSSRQRNFNFKIQHDEHKIFTG